MERRPDPHPGRWWGAVALAALAGLVAAQLAPPPVPLGSPAHPGHRAAAAAPHPGYPSHAGPVGTRPSVGTPAGEGAAATQQKRAWASPLLRIPTSRRVVVLTFEVAWGAAEVRRVLDALTSHGVRATWFVTGAWVLEHPALAAEMIARGHDVGSRGHRQADLARWPADAVRSSLARAHDAIETATARAPRFFRSPGGRWSAVVLQSAAELGYIPVGWGTDSHDWTGPGPDYIVARVLRLARPGDIVRLCANDTCPDTAPALPALIRGLRGARFNLVPLSELLASPAGRSGGVTASAAPARDGGPGGGPTAATSGAGR